MICLDTNYLILGLIPESREASQLTTWVQSGEQLITASIVWYEFLCGPVTILQIETMRAFLREIVPFDEAQATESARLFNVVERKRQLRIDAMIAATALTRSAELATNNQSDFQHFVPFGLKLLGA